MDSKFIFSFILFFSSGVFVGFSQNVDELSGSYGEHSLAQTIGGYLQAAGNNGGTPPANASMDCLQKLLPCQPFLHSPSPPPAACCVPLRELIVNETQCLCAVVSNPGVLQKFNITAGDAMNLAKACGGKADLSACQNATSPAGSLRNPPPPADGANSGSGSSSNSSPPKSSAIRRAANVISHTGLYTFVPFFVGLSLWAAEEQVYIHSFI